MNSLQGSTLSAVNSQNSHGVLIVVARFGFSCSLLATFGAQHSESEEGKILEEINHENRNPYVGSYFDVVRRRLFAYFV